MNHVNEIRNLISGDITENEPLAYKTTLGVGGSADIFVRVRDEDDLSALMQYISANDLPWMILGDGTNLLISDKGIRGIVISLGDEFSKISVDDMTITAGSAAAISKVADIAAKHDLAGLEGVGTVPGSVGGAIVMNAGTHRGYIDAVTKSVPMMMMRKSNLT